MPASRTLRKSLNLSLESASRFPPIDQQRENRKRDWSHCMISVSVLAGFSSIEVSNSSSSITVFLFSSWGGSLTLREMISRSLFRLDFQPLFGKGARATSPKPFDVLAWGGEQRTHIVNSNRRRRPHDGNQKHEMSFQTKLRMYKSLWPDVVLKSRT